MQNRYSKKPLTLALGAAFALAGGAAQASLFQLSDLASGHMVAAADEAKAGEAKCGANCEKNMVKKGTAEADAKAACDKAKSEGKSGSKKEKAEGKCGEGKCGDKKK